MPSLANGNGFSIIKGVCMYWKILGLCPFDFAKATIEKPSYCIIFYTATITLVYITFYYRAVINRMNYIMTVETPIIVIADFLALSIEFFLVISAWMLVILRHDRLRQILNMFKKIQETSRIFAVDQDFRRIFKIIKIHTIIINIIWFILYICDHLFLYEKDTFRLDIWLPFNFPRVISHNVILMFIDVLWVLKKFFCSLNDKIQNLSRKAIVINIIPKQNHGLLDNKSILFFDKQGPLPNYGQLHSDLITLTKMIVEFFSLSIILVMLVDLILMASDLYILCLMPKDQHFMTVKKIGTFIELFCWWCLHVAEIMVLIAMSDSIAKEANRTGIVLHTLLTMDYMEKYIESAQILSLRLFQSYLSIDFYGLLQMRLSLLYKTIGMVGTYLTIMMQLDIQDHQQQQLRKAMLVLNTSHIQTNK